MLFAVNDLEIILDNNEGVFRGHLELFYGRGEYDANKVLFLQRNLCVAHITGENRAEVVLELKGILAREQILIVEEEGDDNARGVSTSGRSGGSEH